MMPSDQPSSTAKKSLVSPLMLVVVAAILILFIAGFSRSEKSTVKQYLTAYMEGNGKKVVSLIPDDCIEQEIKNGYYSNKKEMIADMDATLAYLNAELTHRLGSKWKYDYKVLTSESMARDEIQFWIDYSTYGISYSKIKEAKEVTVQIQLSSENDSYAFNLMLLLVKMGPKWYVADAF